VDTPEHPSHADAGAHVWFIKGHGGWRYLDLFAKAPDGPIATDIV